MTFFSNTISPIQFRIELDRSYGGKDTRDNRAARRAMRTEKEKEPGNLAGKIYQTREEAQAAFDKACLSDDFYVQAFSYL